ncbi:hypothetical protein [Janthinobacterium lividum]|uniref:hypothetical protein n=1 Tax=Janthinobacterium lividum TaxID=29581 RepID=UPI000AF61A02|nr:hypothetical protein [Janthinobacterium lividum]
MKIGVVAESRHVVKLVALCQEVRNLSRHPTLRPDFDATLPHVNPYAAGERVPPCIYQGSLLDALHNEGFSRLVVQLVDWLEKAGDETLINPEQGWEPIRRNGGEHIVDFDIEALETRRPRLGGLQLLTMAQIWAKNGTYSYAHDPQPRTSPHFWGCDLREQLEKVNVGSTYYTGPALLAMCWPTTGFDCNATPNIGYLDATRAHQAFSNCASDWLIYRTWRGFCFHRRCL